MAVDSSANEVIITFEGLNTGWQEASVYYGSDVDALSSGKNIWNLGYTDCSSVSTHGQNSISICPRGVSDLYVVLNLNQSYVEFTSASTDHPASGSGAPSIDPDFDSSSYQRTLSSSNSFSETYNKLPTVGKDATGKICEYVYGIREVSNPTGFTFNSYVNVGANMGDTTHVIPASNPATGSAIIIKNVKTEVQKKAFSFSKIWVKMDASPSSFSTNDLQAWPSQKSITVRVFRKDGNESNSIVDSNFELWYTINGTATPIQPTDGKINGTNLTDAQKATYQLTRSVSNNITTFSLGAVQEKTDDAGTEWVYFVEEKIAPDGYQIDGYGTNSGGSVAKLQGAASASEEGVIINRESSGYELPETGGRGKTFFIVFGILLLATSGVLLALRRKAATS